jgi:hypothetical protein
MLGTTVWNPKVSEQWQRRARQESKVGHTAAVTSRKGVGKQKAEGRTGQRKREIERGRETERRKRKRKEQEGKRKEKEYTPHSIIPPLLK